MIEWIKYDKHNQEIESVTCLVTNGKEVKLAQHAKTLNGEGYSWYTSGGYRLNPVTHWAKINLPAGGIGDE